LDYVAIGRFAGSDLSFPWGVFLLGLVPAILAAFVLFFLGRSRMRALLLAERLGRDLAVSEARARAVMESAVEAILTTDGTSRIETVNPAAETLFGWPIQELIGQKVAMVLPSLEVAEGPDGLSDVQWGASEQMLNAHRRDGSVFHVDVSLAPTSVEERPMYILIARDATLRKLHEDQLTHQATHDPLTGLANRQLFDELLVRSVYRTDRTRAAAAVLYVDLDGFKDVNDLFGHQAGDRVLAETARRLEAVVRPGDVVARLGGDEFAVLCENLTTPADAERIAGRIVDALRRPIPVASGVSQISASVGVAIATPGESAGSVVSRADQAMYEAKRAGKANYMVAAQAG
jgi:diguanylate cyclase (GGDEF)-like protein/PAS domain S-box-containing protein